jgi:hypothetical protein
LLSLLCLLRLPILLRGFLSAGILLRLLLFTLVLIAGLGLLLLICLLLV